MATQLSLRPIETKTKGDIKKLRQAGFVPVSIQHKRGSMHQASQPRSSHKNTGIRYWVFRYLVSSVQVFLCLLARVA